MSFLAHMVVDGHLEKEQVCSGPGHLAELFLRSRAPRVVMVADELPELSGFCWDLLLSFLPPGGGVVAALAFCQDDAKLPVGAQRADELLPGGIISNLVAESRGGETFWLPGVWVIDRRLLSRLFGSASWSEFFNHSLEHREIFGVPVPWERSFLGKGDAKHLGAAEVRRAVFLDRDGTINVDTGYVFRTEDLHFVPGVLPFLRALRRRDFSLIIVTNQAGIAKGKFGLDDVSAFNASLCARLKDEGIEILDTLFCPFHERGVVPAFTRRSLLRKPAPGMVLLAAESHTIDLGKSFMVGDKESDAIDLPYLRSFVLSSRYTGGISRKTYSNFEEILAEIDSSSMISR